MSESQTDVVTPIPHVSCIGLDADDTLWENERFYMDMEHASVDPMSGFCPEEDITAHLARTEERNMPLLGYGSKAMTLSMIETATTLCPDLPARAIQTILAIGRQLMESPVQMLPGVTQTVAQLQKKYRIRILTKGDLGEQTRKFILSPLDQSIPYHVLQDKEADTYARFFEREHIDPTHFVMVGNSPRSDILAPLQLGCWAIHIPHTMTWAHEDLPLPPHPRMRRCQTFEDILKFL